MLMVPNSITAVIDLAGHAFRSWRVRDGSRMWLRDFPLKEVPNTRILTHRYGTNPNLSEATFNILELSKRPLEFVKVISPGTMSDYVETLQPST